MPSFLYPSLLLGLALAALPVLIHLINMMRHRRVRWAAMEFLLVSQKKHHTWIILKQLLLLLMRMAAIAAVVLIVARPLLRSRLSRWFGGARTHHIVLLDDSYSMSDRWSDTSAFDEAKGVIRQIGGEAARQVHPQQFTLLRFSRAQRPGRGTQPDLLKESVDSEFAARLRDLMQKIPCGSTAATPQEALEAIGQLLGSTADEQRIVYLVSDFRARQWSDPQALRQQLLRLNEAGASVMLVNCVEASRPNLAISALAPSVGTRAAGVPLFVEVAVTNYSAAGARDVSVLLEEDGHVRPAIRIAKIDAGKTFRERFSVSFSTAGQHVVAARLETDSVDADNYRCVVLDVPAQVPVLLVDGDPLSPDAKYVSAALSPGGPVRTGLGPRIESPRYLSQQPLDPYAAVYLLNLERLDPAAVTALESYVTAGGNAVFFLGEKTSSRFFNDQLYRDGAGLFPLPLAQPRQLMLDRLHQAPDLDVTDHPMFRIFAGQRNSFLGTVTVDRYFATTSNWKPASESGTRVIARLRNAAPLAVERRFGQGRVVAVLTSAAPTWNNWASGNPTFVVALQDLQAYLGSRPAPSIPVGAPLRLELDAAKYQPRVKFAGPQRSGLAPGPIDAVPGPSGTLVATFADTDSSGIYEAQLSRTDGSLELRRLAVNVDPAEGDLAVSTAEQLAVRLEGLVYEYTLASSFRYQDRQSAGTDLSRPLLYALVALLLLEQLLAWSASYHPTSRTALPTARGGTP